MSPVINQACDIYYRMYPVPVATMNKFSIHSVPSSWNILLAAKRFYRVNIAQSNIGINRSPLLNVFPSGNIICVLTNANYSLCLEQHRDGYCCDPTFTEKERTHHPI